MTNPRNPARISRAAKRIATTGEQWRRHGKEEKDITLFFVKSNSP